MLHPQTQVTQRVSPASHMAVDQGVGLSCVKRAAANLSHGRCVVELSSHAADDLTAALTLILGSF